jgi:hypothetical protein
MSRIGVFGVVGFSLFALVGPSGYLRQVPAAGLLPDSPPARAADQSASPGSSQSPGEQPKPPSPPPGPGGMAHPPDPFKEAATAPLRDGRFVDVPAVDIGTSTLPARAATEKQANETLGVFHGFRFENRLKASGITFVNQVVDDAGLTYKAAHYDHGNGIAAADVDGDGRIDIYFTSQLGGNELWKNLGNGTFKNVTAEAGVGVPGRISVSATFADIDNDGDQDLFVTTVRGGNVLFENDGHGRFKDISKEAGLDYVGHSSGAVFFDYDKDGRLDLFLVNVGRYTSDEKGRGGAYVAYRDAFSGHKFPERTETSILYHNEGGNHFRDVSRETGLVDGSWSGDASIADFNGDGWPDLYVLNMQGQNHYWVNEGGRHFADRTAQYFPKTPWGAMGIKVFDADNDGDMDLLVTDMHSDMVKPHDPDAEKTRNTDPHLNGVLGDPEKFVFGNAFYQNQGDGTFKELALEMNLENYWPWGVSVNDLNADGWQDVLITSGMNYPFRYGINSLLLNDRGKRFADAEFTLGLEPRPQTRQPWFTFDCSGEKKHPLCGDKKGTYTATGTLGSRSSVIFDLDGDGDLDIVTNEFNGPPMVLVSNLTAVRRSHYLKVRLTGKESNRNGIGALVKVSAGGLTQSRVMDGSSGYLSHSILPLYFGLGGAATVDRIEVRWPSGKQQAIAGPIAADRQLDLTEGEAPALKHGTREGR